MRLDTHDVTSRTFHLINWGERLQPNRMIRHERLFLGLREGSQIFKPIFFVSLSRGRLFYRRLDLSGEHTSQAESEAAEGAMRARTSGRRTGPKNTDRSARPKRSAQLAPARPLPNRLHSCPTAFRGIREKNPHL